MSPIARAAGAALLTALAAPAAAQRLPADLAGRLIAESLWTGGSTLRFIDADRATAAALRPRLETGRRAVEAYFGSPFPERVTATLAPDRATFTAVLNAEWGVPETQCWMVGTGVADFLVILSPRDWAAEACEHDAADTQHVQDIVTHELTHVYHGQRNPTRDFDGADEVGWFAEGLAVVVAGQLDRGRMSDPREAVRAGAVPARLADAWSGRYRYGVSGSLVRYIDVTWGRDAVRDLLAVTTQAQLLTRIGVTEQELLDRWKAWVMEPER
jgi:hypothetical protein